MKLIQEANADDMFNAQMMKIQDAVERLEKLVQQIDLPVNSQIRALEYSAEDLKRMADSMTEKRKAKGLK
jgi:hypothetical protein